MVRVTLSKAVLRQSAAACAASLSVLSSATIYAWVSPLLPNFLGPNSEIPMTAEEASWMVAIADIGFIVSPLPVGVMCDCIGRKVVLLLTAPMILIGWITILYFRTLTALLVARVIQGFGAGTVSTVLPLYLGEISIPKYRGAVTSGFYSFWWFGYLFEYSVGPHLSFKTFTYVTASMNVVFFLAFLWFPESPYYYLIKNNEDKARKSLSWLFSTTEEETEIELDRMRKGHNKNKVLWTELFTKASNRKGMAIVLVNGYARVFCGLLPLSSYSTLTLKTAGGNFFISPENVTIIMGVMMFLGSVCSSFTLDSFGRKPLLLFSSLISATIMFFVGIFYYIDSNTSIDASSFNWVPSIGLIVYSAVSVVGIYGVSTTYQSELFDSSTRATASIVLNILNTVGGLIIYKYYLPISIYVGTWVDFLIFTITCFISAYTAWFLMPETKGKSFEQIISELNGNIVESKL